MSEASSSSSAPSNGALSFQAVREIPIAESDEAAECLAHAFAVDEVAMYFIETDDTVNWSAQEKWDMHVRIMRSIVKAHCLKGLVLTVGPNYGCVALWMPPGKNMDDTLTMFRSNMWRLNHKLSQEGRNRFKEEFLPLLHKTKTEVLGDLDNDSWYLVYIGTKPEARGKGYARRLIEHVTTQADEHGRVCYLESSNGNNPPIYRKYGFETIKTIYLTQGPKPVEMEIMVRQPVPRNSSQNPPGNHGSAQIDNRS
ncbi:MAG: hypothetical protein L6R36_003557 [Xanthoria steineri]|nr:MAG: hypothetical protein L6R36_003557 [Xanthoria steineri]